MSSGAEALRQAAALLDAYTALGTPEELRELRLQLEAQRVEAAELRTEAAELCRELEAKCAVIERLNRRIEWMQSHVKARQG